MAKCELCRSDQQDPVQFGEFLSQDGKSVHTYCLYLSSSLAQNGDDDEGILGFLIKDILAERRRVSLLYCCYCGGKHANVGCCEVRCRRCFHTICGIENGALNEFVGSFKSYCDRHVRQSDCKLPANEVCCICYDKLCETKKRLNAVNIIRAPCCRNGWFHKLCLQRFAYTAGYFFKCPLCNDSKVFRQQVPYYGIFIPQRDAAWELEPNAYTELLERPNECTAESCRNAAGRGSSDDDDNPLLLCETCGSVAIHKRCMNFASKKFQCNNCKQMLNSDSGRESMHSPHAEVLLRNDSSVEEVEEAEDEHIDVCGNSDDSDMEEKQQFEKKIMYSIDGKNIEKHNTSHMQKNYCNMPQFVDGNDSDDTVNEPNAVMKSKEKCRESANEDDSSMDEDTIQIKSKHRKKSLRVIDDSDLESLKNHVTNTASHTVKQQVHESSDSDEDPLENFAIIMDRLKSKPCKARNGATPANASDATVCGRGNADKKKDSTVDIGKQKLDSNSLHHQPSGSAMGSEFENHERACSIKSESSLEISCIARRTRRCSKFVVNDDDSSSSTDRAPTETENNSLNVSCVAQRTRRKSMPLNFNIQQGGSNACRSGNRSSTKSLSSHRNRSSQPASAEQASDSRIPTKRLRADSTDSSFGSSQSAIQIRSTRRSTRRSKSQQNNTLDVSCIAQRTRRKSKSQSVRRHTQQEHQRSNSLISETDGSSVEYEGNGFDNWHSATKNGMNELATLQKSTNADTNKSSVASDNSSCSYFTNSYPTSTSSLSSSSVATVSASLTASNIEKLCTTPPSKGWFNYVCRRISRDSADSESSFTSSTPHCNTLLYHANVSASSQNSSDPYIMPKFKRVDGKLKRVYDDDTRQESSCTPIHHNFMRSYNLLLNASNRKNEHDKFHQRERRNHQQRHVLHSHSGNFKCL